MGFDISYHPVDIELIRTRLLPYIAGTDDSLDDLAELVAIRSHVSERAQEWSQKNQDYPGFDPYLHRAGRPYFIPGPDPSLDLDRWLAVRTLAEADQLARELLERAGGRMRASLPVRSERPSLPREEALAELNYMRVCCRALRTGEPVLRKGEKVDPDRSLESYLPMVLLSFTSKLHAAWVDRNVWPSQFFPEEFHDHRVLLADFPAQFPQLNFEWADTIQGAYSVGGWLPHERIAPVLKRFEELAELSPEEIALAAESRYQTIDPSSIEKIIEALADADRRGMAFCEATEVVNYSFS